MASTRASFGYISPQTVKVFLEGDSTNRYLSHLTANNILTVEFDALTDGQSHRYVLQVEEAGKPTLTDTFELTCQPNGSGGSRVTSVSVSGSNTGTSGTTAQYTAVADGSDPRTYQWSVTGGTLVGSASEPTVSVQWGPAGIGSLSVVVSGYQGSSATGQKAVTIQPSQGCVCSLSVMQVAKKAGSGRIYQAALDSPNANINPFTWEVKNPGGQTVASGQTTPSSSPVVEFEVPADLESGSYTVSFSSVPCSCSSAPFTFTHLQTTEKPRCEEGPQLLLVSALSLNQIQFSFHGRGIQTLDWSLVRNGNTVEQGNTGPLTSNVVTLDLDNALAEGTYTFQIASVDCQGDENVSTSQPLVITSGGGGTPDNCSCTLEVTATAQVGQTGTISVTAVSPDADLGIFDYVLLDGNNNPVASGTLNTSQA